jgi:hypothetical protein
MPSCPEHTRPEFKVEVEVEAIAARASDDCK